MSQRLQQPLLSISIPTFNRADLLAKNISQLAVVAAGLWDELELIISDNASPDNTKEVVENAIANGVPIKYIRNVENIGSDSNIAQSFNLASGKYVVILGDDDFFMDGTLEFLLKHLKSFNYGVVCMKSYGFDRDFKSEYPGFAGKVKSFTHPSDFLRSIGQFITLISACAINKSLIPKTDANDFIGSNLVQVHLVLAAALAAEKNLHLDKYILGCKRNNSGGYDFSKVFVVNLGSIFDQYIDSNAVKKIENGLIISFFPYYILRQRLKNAINLETTLINFNSRFKDRLIFKIWLRPILIWPKALAIPWGGMVTLIGRIMGGDLRRGYYFVLNTMKRVIR